MFTDIRINPDNKLSENIGIINYPFNYPSTWWLILFVYLLFCVVSQNFYAIFIKKFFTLIRVYPKY